MKAFLTDQCKEIEENNRMRKTRDIFKKIRDTKGTIHTKMGTIKDQNGMDLTEAKDIKKRWQEYCIANGKYTQYFVIITRGKNLKKDIYICVCIYIYIYIHTYTELLWCTRETNTIL